MNQNKDNSNMLSSLISYLSLEPPSPPRINLQLKGLMLKRRNKKKKEENEESYSAYSECFCDFCQGGWVYFLTALYEGI